MKQSFFIWIICSRFLLAWGIQSNVKVPDIDGCQYIDADLVECWWTRPLDYNKTTYRLSYLREVDPHHQRVHRICQPTEEHAYKQDVKQYCTVNNVTPYARFNFSVSALCKNCEKDDCICGRGNAFLFECDPHDVILQSPPVELKLESLPYKLSWLPPHKPQSMMSFVRKIMTVEYKLEYKSLVRGKTNTDAKWQVWFVGNQTSFYVPTLVPGVKYMSRVLARYIPLHDAGLKIWSSPSNAVEFFGKAPPAHTTDTTSPFTTFTNEDPLSTQAGYESTSEVIPASHVALGLCVSSLPIIVLVLVLYYLVSRTIGCSRSKKIPKPVMMIEVEPLDAQLQERFGNYDEFGEEEEEILLSSRLHQTYPSTVCSSPKINALKNELLDSISSQITFEHQTESNKLWKCSNPFPKNFCNSTETPNVDFRNDIQLLPLKQFHTQQGESLNNNKSSTETPSTIRTTVTPDSEKSFSQCDISSRPQQSPKTDEVYDQVSPSTFRDNNSLYTTTMDYVMSNATSSAMEYVGVDDQCSCSELSKTRSLTGSTELLPDYVKQAKGNQHIELFLAITSETAHHSNHVKYKGYHYCDCRKVLLKTGTTIANVLEAVCPACQKIIDMKQTISKGNETIINAVNQLTLPSNNSENRRSSTSDNSVDSGYSPDSPMTP
uniref:Uncharacterized protein LOC100179003 n=1 Tax=Phallusia mammillata TaxID=59560 RepID=A0A6F9DGE8_9ASCI|nr:uncharacterized protein LOC100179003 [Phallusia mammillata]